jgi:hypothetical protein
LASLPGYVSNHVLRPASRFSADFGHTAFGDAAKFSPQQTDRIQRQDTRTFRASAQSDQSRRLQYASRSPWCSGTARPLLRSAFHWRECDGRRPYQSRSTRPKQDQHVGRLRGTLLDQAPKRYSRRAETRYRESRKLGCGRAQGVGAGWVGGKAHSECEAIATGGAWGGVRRRSRGRSRTAACCSTQPDQLREWRDAGSNAGTRVAGSGSRSWRSGPPLLGNDALTVRA